MGWEQSHQVSPHLACRLQSHCMFLPPPLMLNFNDAIKPFDALEKKNKTKKQDVFEIDSPQNSKQNTAEPLNASVIWVTHGTHKERSETNNVCMRQ